MNCQYFYSSKSVLCICASNRLKSLFSKCSIILLDVNVFDEFGMCASVFFVSYFVRTGWSEIIIIIMIMVINNNK